MKKIKIEQLQDRADTHILNCKVMIDHKTAKTMTRTGLSYVCQFKENEIELTYPSPFLSNMAKGIHLAYQEIDHLKFSIARLAPRTLFPQSPRYVLDILIYLKSGKSYHLETFAFALLSDISQLMKKHQVQVVDELNLMEAYSNLDLSEVMNQLDLNYASLIELYQLEAYRIHDQRS